jgi:outer membrane protein TolC
MAGFAAVLFMSSWHVALASDESHLFNNTQQMTATQLVKAVLIRNHGLSAMHSAVEAVHAKIGPAGALEDPMLAYALAPETVGGFRTPGGRFRGLNQRIELSQAIPWPGTLNLRSKAAVAETESVAQKLSDFRLQLAERTRAAYAEWYYVHRALAVNAENRALLARLRGVAETAYGAGQAPQQDVLQAEVELIRLQNQALEIERRRATVQAGINGLLNRDPRAPLPLPQALPPAGNLPDYANLQQMALARYPALKRLDAEIDAGQDRVELAHKGFYPDFKLSAGYNNLWDAPEKQFTVGAAINIPIGVKHQGELEAANARLRQRRAERMDARASLLSSLDQSYRTAQQAKDSIALYADRMLPLASLNLKAAEADYSGGSGDFLKLITAEQQYLIAKLELSRSHADFFIQFAALDYRTGGALTANQTQETKP